MTSHPWLLFVRARGGFGCAAVSLVHAALFALASTITVTAGIASPATSISVPLGSVLPAIAVLCFLPVVSRPQPAEESAARPGSVYRWSLLMAMLALAVGSLLVAGLLTNALEAAIVPVRNVSGLLGMTLTLRPSLGHAAWLCPTMFAATELAFGATAASTPASWAWTLHASSSLVGDVTAAVWMCLGGISLARDWRPSRPQRR
jgi:hypothetical protein